MNLTKTEIVGAACIVVTLCSVIAFLIGGALRYKRGYTYGHSRGISTWTEQRKDLIGDKNLECEQRLKKAELKCDERLGASFSAMSRLSQ